MAEPTQEKSWLLVQVENAVRAGLTRAYERIRVEPDEFLFHLRAAHGLPVETYDGLFSVPVVRLDDIADQTIRAGMKLAAAEGAGFGMGGFLTIVPDLGILAAITMRTLQKLSLIYGFQFSTDEEQAELWIAAATAAGVDISRDLLERSVLTRFVPKVIQRIAVSASAEIVEKWSARLIPVLSSGIGATFNYYFVRAWGRRALAHFRARHLQIRDQRTQCPVLLPPAPEGAPGQF
ncbi:MAG: EcsC family protein [Candidatus Korobacteraceae bacterium]